MVATIAAATFGSARMPHAVDGMAWLIEVVQCWCKDWSCHDHAARRRTRAARLLWLYPDTPENRKPRFLFSTKTGFHFK